MNRLMKIVITGSCCAGKTSAMPILKKHFDELGFHTLIIPETATELMDAGILHTQKDFQKYLMQLQLFREESFESLARADQDHPETILIFDRGTIDGGAFSDPEEFAENLEFNHLTYSQALEEYDCVFLLKSLASDPKTAALFSSDTNPNRFEDPAQAREQDERLIRLWKAHPDFSVIENEETFEEKMDHLISKMEKRVFACFHRDQNGGRKAD